MIYVKIIWNLQIWILLASHVNSWWLMSQMASTQIGSNYCRQMMGLSRRQRMLCYKHEEATRATHRGLLSALNECRIQFSRERWDCSTASIKDQSIGNRPALVNLHNYRVGRRLLTSMMRRNCKCHGVSGSCVTRTCWQVVPSLEEYSAALKNKYITAQKVKQLDDTIELVVLKDPIPPLISRNTASRNERGAQSYNVNMPPQIYNLNANRDALVYLESSPDYCTTNSEENIRGTNGRECFSPSECTQLCCSRGWRTTTEIRQEPCRCKFIWCCEVKCDTCWRDVERYFCN